MSTLEDLKAGYEDAVAQFYAFLPEDVRQVFIDDATFHKTRYLDLLSLSLGRAALEVGSDKPFITHMLRELHPECHVRTISIDIPYTPYPIIRIDIESQPFPIEDGSIDTVIFTEVLEHLFRDPAHTAFEINRVLPMGGTLFLTTPNACGYDCLVNLVNQQNPNGRSQFFEAIESGHPHLWTAAETELLLVAHGFDIASLSTVDYYPIAEPPAIRAFLAANSVRPDLNRQVIRVIARKIRNCKAPVYPSLIFPQKKPVGLQGALLTWFESMRQQDR